MKAPSSSPAADTRDGIAYAEILKIAHEEGLRSISTELIVQPSEENGQRCIVKATVEVERGRFEGIGDADPSNVEPDFAPHLIRMAETRAKARALRDAVNVGVVSFEELDGEDLPGAGDPSDLGSGAIPHAASRPARNGSPPSPPSAAPAVQSDVMTESQRRFLFRLLATQGMVKDVAHEHLLGHFQVFSLSEVTKSQASALIDELQARPRERQNGGAALQR